MTKSGQASLLNKQKSQHESNRSQRTDALHVNLANHQFALPVLVYQSSSERPFLRNHLNQLIRYFPLVALEKPEEGDEDATGSKTLANSTGRNKCLTIMPGRQQQAAGTTEEAPLMIYIEDLGAPATDSLVPHCLRDIILRYIDANGEILHEDRLHLPNALFKLFGESLGVVQHDTSVAALFLEPKIVKGFPKLSLSG